MSEAEKENKEKLTLKQKCADCVKGPKNVIKTLILMICVAAVLQQISACVRKLIDIPITTYTHFDFNKTIMYPSVTFCRDPPYKISRMRDYGLDRLNPDIAPHWEHFDFKKYSLDEVWENITLNVTDMFVSYGLDNLEENVELIPTMGFTQGRCYTMSPKTLGTEASSGYSVTLQHTLDSIAETGSVNLPGYHVYIHYTKEPFTEVAVYNGGLVEKLYVNVGETLQVKLKVDKYLMISTADDPCVKEPNYSANACTTQFVWDQVGRKVGCSGPWMQSDLPRCKNYSSMLDLIFNYNNLSKNHRYTHCPRTCDSYIYNGYVTDRQKRHWDSGAIDTLMSSDFVDESELQTTVKLYFGSMMVSVYEERYNYDGNMFLSDLGGSIGFLLGLSVIGLLEVFSKFWTTCIEPLFSKKKKAGSITSSDTADLQSRQEYIDEWNLKNVK